MRYPIYFRDNFWAPAAAITLAGFLFNFIAVFPGLTTWDSFVMWNMGVEWKFKDWHHPFIGVLMGMGRFIRDDPSPYLFFQLGLLWSGIYMFTVALRNQVGKWAIVAAFIGLLPFNLFMSGYLHKTPLLTACFFFSSSWLFLSYTRDKRLTFTQVTGLILIVFLGSVVRGYSYVSALPILVFMAWMLLRPMNIRHVCVWAVAFATTMVVVYVGANHFLLYEVLGAEKTYKPQAVYLFDMAAIYALTGKVYGEEFLKDEFKDRNAALKKYNKEMKSSIYKIMNMYRSSRDAGDVRKMRSEWWRAVSENFQVYLRHRTNAVLKSLGVTANRVKVFKGFNAKSRKNIYNLEKWDTAFWNLLKGYMHLVKDGFFMMPWFWVPLNGVFSLIGVVLFFSPRYRALVLPHCVMLWSGVLLVAPYLLVCLSPDARFTHWITVATSFGGLGLACVFFTRWREIYGKKAQAA